MAGKLSPAAAQESTREVRIPPFCGGKGRSQKRGEEPEGGAEKEMCVCVCKREST